MSGRQLEGRPIRLFRRLVAPHAALTDAQAREQSTILRAVIPAMVVFGVAMAVHSEQAAREVYTVATCVAVAAWMLSRTRHVGLTGLAAALACTTVPWLGFATEAATTSATAELMWLIIGMGLSLLSMPARAFAGFALVNLVITGALLAANEAIPAGAVLEVLIYLLFVSVIALLVGVSRDGSARRLDREIRSSKETLEAMPDPLLVADAEQAIATVNGAFLRLVGGSLEQLVGRPVAEVVEGWEAVAAEGMGSGGVGDVSLRSEAGDVIPIQLHTMRLPGSAATGRSAGIIGVGRDMRETHRLLAEAATAEAHRVTAADLRSAHEELVQTQAQLVQAGKLAALGQLAAAVAHEINNPLTGVTLAASLLDGQVKAGMPDPARAQRYVDQVREASERCRAIVSGLLKFGRGEVGDRVPVELGSVVDAALGLVGHKLSIDGAEVSLVAPAPVFVLGSEGQLLQVMLNLLLNAGDALAGPGQVDVTISEVDGTARLEVTDGGVGVDPAIRGEIFDPFFTTKGLGEGTGLGLSVTYGIVADHGGTLELLGPEHGPRTTFRIELPALAAELRSPR